MIGLVASRHLRIFYQTHDNKVLQNALDAGRNHAQILLRTCVGCPNVDDMSFCVGYQNVYGYTDHVV